MTPLPRLILAAFCGLALSVPVLTGCARPRVAEPPAPPAIHGFYLCAGEDGRRAYKLDLEIRPHREASYLLRWFDRGRRMADGIGVLEGGRLSVAFTNGRGVGVASYEIGAERLTGRWTAGEATYPERCQRARMGAAAD
jgi:hypothetical protein